LPVDNTLPPLREVIARHGLAAKKSFGQHFLLDQKLTDKIVRTAGDLTGVHILEIGPGPGGLTRSLLASTAKSVTVIEIDRRAIDVMQELQDVYGERLKIIEGDALKMDVATLCPAPRAIVANLPYNVGTELLIQWLQKIDDFQSLTLMFQREVVDRIMAKPSSKTYGRLSIISQFCCHMKKVMAIPAGAFTPPPTVESAVIHMTPRTDRPRDITLQDLEKITAAAFGQRRKMLRSSLKTLGGEVLLKKAGLDPTARAEDLSVDDFANLVRAFTAPAARI
jgi:16S rRNA (adenine1518-N6/adenine1519-N6)-dimethyltransferase